MDNMPVLISILRLLGVKLDKFLDLNPYVDCDSLFFGQLLCIGIPQSTLKKYSVPSIKLTWPDAVLYCAKKNKRLASNADIDPAQISQLGYAKVHVGYRAAGEEGSWIS